MVKTKPVKPKEKKTVVSNKKKDRDQFIKEMDMLRLKQKINEIMKKVSNDKSKIENNNIKYKKNIELINEKYSDNSNIIYQKMFHKYMKEEFTLICASFINKIIINIKRDHLEQYEGKYNFNKLLLSLTKELLLNEFELIILSLYLEYIDISLYLDNFTMEESFLFLCLFVKTLTIKNDEIEPIKSYLNNKYNNLDLNYEKWYNLNEKKLNNKLFNYIEINQRFREYNAPFSVYCGDNYIDYNYVVDRILTMSLPYVDVKKDNNTSVINNINNNSPISTENDINKNNNNKNNDNDINNNYINNNYISNNYINNNYINNNKININLDDYHDCNKKLLHPEPFINIGLKSNINSNKSIKNESTKNSNYNLFNINNNNFIKDKNNKDILNNIPVSVTPNNLLHSLSNMNRYVLGPGTNKMLINPNIIGNINNKSINLTPNDYIDINRTNIIHSTRQIEENFGPKKMNSNLIMNAMPTPSQSSFLFQQKPSLMEINLFNRNNSSHMFEDEGETLKQILRASNDNYFKSSMSFDSPEFPYNSFVNNANNNNINNNPNHNIVEQKCGDNNRRKYNNDIPFRPLNTVINLNTDKKIISQNNFNNIGIDYVKQKEEIRNNESNIIKKN